MSPTLTVRKLRDIPQAVLIARRAAGLTQAEVAQRAGVSTRWLSLFENGRTPGAELQRVLAVLAALKIQVRLDLPDENDDADAS